MCIFSYVKNVFVGASLVCVLGGMQIHAENLKECKTKQDKISGCVVIEPTEIGSITTPYKNGTIHGVMIVEGEILEKTPYINGKKEGIQITISSNEEAGETRDEIPYKNDIRNGLATFFLHEKIAGSILFQDDKAISAQCTNGKKFTQDSLQKINTDTYYTSSIVYYDVCQVLEH